MIPVPVWQCCINLHDARRVSGDAANLCDGASTRASRRSCLHWKGLIWKAQISYLPYEYLHQRQLQSKTEGQKWMQELTPAEYETYPPIKFYNGQFWCRVSGQIYLTLDDFEWAAMTLLQLCERARQVEWAS